MIRNGYLRRQPRSGSVFFFFQAEDGIRDDLVTGVQTCALPISSTGPAPAGSPVSTVSCSRTYQPAYPCARRYDTIAATSTSPVPRGRYMPWRTASEYESLRSEERRVGKECRERWARGHERSRDQ